jgi:phosphoribosylaminoimidazole-succinocarboxamide synthase
MNTETLDLITNVIEEMIAAIPQIVVVLTTVVYSLNAIKARVNSFPVQIKETKDTMNLNLKETKDSVNSSLSQSKKEISEIVNDMRKEMLKSVNETLVDMKKELVDYQNDLKSSSDQTNMLVRQNKILMQVISDLVGKDTEMVAKGVAKQLAFRTNLSKEELENYPELLIKELPMLENALKEAMLVLGDGKFEEMLKKVGYGKNH